VRPRVYKILVYPECLRKAFSVGRVAKTACKVVVAYLLLFNIDVIYEAAGVTGFFSSGWGNYCKECQVSKTGVSQIKNTLGLQ